MTKKIEGVFLFEKRETRGRKKVGKRKGEGAMVCHCWAGFVEEGSPEASAYVFAPAAGLAKFGGLTSFESQEGISQ